MILHVIVCICLYVGNILYCPLPSLNIHCLLSMSQPWSWYWGHRSPNPLTCSVCEDDGDKCTECSHAQGALQRNPVSPARDRLYQPQLSWGVGLWYFWWMFWRELQRLPDSSYLGPCLQCVPWKTCSWQCLMPPLQPAQKLFLPMDAAGPNYWGVNQLLSPATSPSGTQPVMDGNWSKMSRSLTLEQDNSEAHCFPELPSGLKSPQELECTFLSLLCLTSLHTLPPPGNYLHLNPCRRIYSWEIRLRGQERRTCQGSLNCKGRSPWAGPWLPANLQHQQDGWNDQAWIGEEGKDLAQEGWEIIFNCLLDDIIHSVFPTGKRRGYIIAYFLAHMAWMTVSILGGFRPPLTPALLEEQSSSA